MYNARNCRIPQYPDNPISRTSKIKLNIHVIYIEIETNGFLGYINAVNYEYDRNYIEKHQETCVSVANNLYCRQFEFKI